MGPIGYGLYQSGRTLYDAGKRTYEMADLIGTAWLYGEWSEEKLKHYEFLNNVPIVKDWMNYKLDLRADAEYMARYGLDYSDIHDPRKLRQTSSGTALIGSSIRFISDNFKRLYR